MGDRIDNQADRWAFPFKVPKTIKPRRLGESIIGRTKNSNLANFCLTFRITRKFPNLNTTKESSLPAQVAIRFICFEIPSSPCFRHSCIWPLRSAGGVKRKLPWWGYEVLEADIVPNPCFQHRAPNFNDLRQRRSRAGRIMFRIFWSRLGKLSWDISNSNPYSKATLTNSEINFFNTFGSSLIDPDGVSQAFLARITRYAFLEAFAAIGTRHD